MAKAWAQEAGLEHPIALCHLEVPCCPFDSTACIPRSCARTGSKIMIKSPELQENLPTAESWWDAAFYAKPLLRSGGFSRELPEIADRLLLTFDCSRRRVRIVARGLGVPGP